MEKEDIAVLAHVLTGMKEAAEKLQKAEKKKDFEDFSAAKNEILKLKMEIDKLI